MPNRFPTSRRSRRLGPLLAAVAMLAACSSGPASAPRDSATVRASAPRNAATTVRAADPRIDEQMERYRRTLVRRRGFRMGARDERAVADVDKALRAMVLYSVDPLDPEVLGNAAVRSIDYAVAEEVTTEQAAVLAIQAMMAAADPDGSYVDEAASAAPPADPAARAGGIGLELKVRDGFPVVVAPIPSGPADRAGFVAGDRIVAVDGMPTDGLTLREAVDRLRGPVGTMVAVTLRRDAQADTIVKLERTVVALRSAMVMQKTTDCAALRLSQFGDDTGKELSATIAEVAGDGPLRGLVLDLRGNGGGLMSAVIASADLFLDSGTIAKVAGRGRGAITVYSAQPGGPAVRTPVVVLVDGETAAGAEIFAAALRDNGRARILGWRTAGRGSIQTRVALGETSALKLTTSRVWTAAGQPVSAGILPDGDGAGAVRDPRALVQRAFDVLGCGGADPAARRSERPDISDGEETPALPVELPSNVAPASPVEPPSNVAPSAPPATIPSGEPPPTQPPSGEPSPTEPPVDDSDNGPAEIDASGPRAPSA